VSGHPSRSCSIRYQCGIGNIETRHFRVRNMNVRHMRRASLRRAANRPGVRVDHGHPSRSFSPASETSKSDTFAGPLSAPGRAANRLGAAGGLRAGRGMIAVIITIVCDLLLDPLGGVVREARLKKLVKSGSSGCLNATCVQCENGESISPMDSAQPTMAHDADTDSPDLARPPDGKHPSARNATPAMLLRSATRRRTAGHVVAHPGPSDLE
jgi:hypothetical protein